MILRFSDITLSPIVAFRLLGRVNHVQLVKAIDLWWVSTQLRNVATTDSVDVLNWITRNTLSLLKALDAAGIRYRLTSVVSTDASEVLDIHPNVQGTVMVYVLNSATNASSYRSISDFVSEVTRIS